MYVVTKTHQILNNVSPSFRFLSWCPLSQNPFLRIFSFKAFNITILKSHIITSLLTTELLNWMQRTWNSSVTHLSLPSASLSIISTSCLPHTDGIFCPLDTVLLLRYFLDFFFSSGTILFHLISILPSCFYQLHCFPPCLGCDHHPCLRFKVRFGVFIL